MDNILNILAVILMLAGLILIIISLRKRSSEHPPLSSLNVKNWIPLWKMKPWFTANGYRLHLSGWILFFAGTAIKLIQYF